MYRDEERRWHSADDEIRRSAGFQREPVTEFASIISPLEVAQFVQVCDESLDGLGLLVNDRTGFRLGMEVELEFGGATFYGVVCHVTKHDDVDFVIGVRQLRSPLRARQ